MPSPIHPSKSEISPKFTPGAGTPAHLPKSKTAPFDDPKMPFWLVNQSRPFGWFIPGKNPKRSENGERRRLRDLSVPDSLLRLHRTAWK